MRIGHCAITGSLAGLACGLAAVPALGQNVFVLPASPTAGSTFPMAAAFGLVTDSSEYCHYGMVPGFTVTVNPPPTSPSKTLTVADTGPSGWFVNIFPAEPPLTAPQTSIGTEAAAELPGANTSRPTGPGGAPSQPLTVGQSTGPLTPDAFYIAQKEKENYYKLHGGFGVPPVNTAIVQPSGTAPPPTLVLTVNSSRGPSTTSDCPHCSGGYTIGGATWDWRLTPTRFDRKPTPPNPTPAANTPSQPTQPSGPPKIQITYNNGKFSSAAVTAGESATQFTSAKLILPVVTDAPLPGPDAKKDTATGAGFGPIEGVPGGPNNAYIFTIAPVSGSGVSPTFEPGTSGAVVASVADLFENANSVGGSSIGTTFTPNASTSFAISGGPSGGSITQSDTTSATLITPTISLSATETVDPTRTEVVGPVDAFKGVSLVNGAGNTASFKIGTELFVRDIVSGEDAGNLTKNPAIEPDPCLGKAPMPPGKAVAAVDPRDALPGATIRLTAPL